MVRARTVRGLSLSLIAILMVGAVAWPEPVSAGGGALPAPLPTLNNFITSVMTGNRRVVTGVYADGLFALRVVQQVCRMCVSRENGTATQFAWAQKYGVTGLIAHDWLSGSNFYGLQPGQRIELVYGDGRTETYWITQVNRYRQTMPGSTATGYIDLATGRGYDVEGMFRKVYMGTDHVTFQTCIAKDGNLSWGMLFAIAEKSPYPPRTWKYGRLDPSLPWGGKSSILPS